MGGIQRVYSSFLELFGCCAAGFAAVVVLLVIGVFLFLRKRRSGGARPMVGDPLMKSRSRLTLLEQLFVRTRTDQNALAEIEELLITSDFGVHVTQNLIGKMRGEGPEKSPSEMLLWLKQEVQRSLLSREAPFIASSPVPGDRPRVVMVVGVNGVGKTTTIGKLAHYYKDYGHRVMVVAADTFRAAAIEQLDLWAKRASAATYSKGEGASPSGVAYDGLTKAKETHTTLVIVDSAGRLHTKRNLMDELKKMKRVMGQVIESAPDEIWMVIDATLGQNTFAQVREFHEALGLTGLILAKIDGTSRGGIAVSVCQEFGVPILFLGTGEGLGDLKAFSAEGYVEGLFRAGPS